jgi:hypothetical protein
MGDEQDDMEDENTPAGISYVYKVIPGLEDAEFLDLDGEILLAPYEEDFFDENQAMSCRWWDQAEPDAFT